MRKLGIGLVLAAVLAAAGWYEFGRSPAAEAHAVLNGKSVEIRYSAPSVRGRQIFGPGGLLSGDPTYPVWRAGANAATTLVTAGDLNVASLRVPAGTYKLWVLIADPDAWELIVNHETGQWGRSYDESQDLGRVTMTMARPAAPAETLKYTVADLGSGLGELRLEWENRIGTVPLAME